MIRTSPKQAHQPRCSASTQEGMEDGELQGQGWPASAGEDSGALAQAVAQVQGYEQWFNQLIMEQAAGQPPDAAEEGQNQDLQEGRSRLAALVATLHSSAAAKAHLLTLKHWAEAVRELERRCRGLTGLDASEITIQVCVPSSNMHAPVVSFHDYAL